VILLLRVAAILVYDDPALELLPVYDTLAGQVMAKSFSRKDTKCVFSDINIIK
jgi:hypothetical protein